MERIRIESTKKAKEEGGGGGFISTMAPAFGSNRCTRTTFGLTIASKIDWWMAENTNV
jgi:hypothetical protein